MGVTADITGGAEVPSETVQPEPEVLPVIVVETDLPGLNISLPDVPDTNQIADQIKDRFTAILEEASGWRCRYSFDAIVSVREGLTRFLDEYKDTPQVAAVLVDEVLAPKRGIKPSVKNYVKDIALIALKGSRCEEAKRLVTFESILRDPFQFETNGDTERLLEGYLDDTRYVDRMIEHILKGLPGSDLFANVLEKSDPVMQERIRGHLLSHARHRNKFILDKGLLLLSALNYSPENQTENAQILASVISDCHAVPGTFLAAAVTALGNTHQSDFMEPILDRLFDVTGENQGLINVNIAALKENIAEPITSQLNAVIRDGYLDTAWVLAGKEVNRNKFEAGRGILGRISLTIELFTNYRSMLRNKRIQVAFILHNSSDEGIKKRAEKILDKAGFVI